MDKVYFSSARTLKYFLTSTTAKKIMKRIVSSSISSNCNHILPTKRLSHHLPFLLNNSSQDYDPTSNGLSLTLPHSSSFDASSLTYSIPPSSLEDTLPHPQDDISYLYNPYPHEQSPDTSLLISTSDPKPLPMSYHQMDGHENSLSLHTHSQNSSLPHSPYSQIHTSYEPYPYLYIPLPDHEHYTPFPYPFSLFSCEKILSPSSNNSLITLSETEDFLFMSRKTHPKYLLNFLTSFFALSPLQAFPKRPLITSAKWLNLS